MGRKVGENKGENNTQLTSVELPVAQSQGGRSHCCSEFAVSAGRLASPGLHPVAVPWENASVTAIPPLVLCVLCEISCPAFKFLVKHKTQGLIST